MSAEDRAYKVLREAILNGTYPRGERLLEEALAVDLGVSRTPIRAALQRLALEGLIEFRRYVGAVVRVLPIQEVDQIFQLRGAVESLAAELAATRIAAAEIERIEGLCDRMDRIAAVEIPDLGEIARLNKELHQTILAASGNLYVQRVAVNLTDLNFMVHSYRRYARRDLERSLSQHHELAAAFRARNPSWARSVMTSHVEGARSLIQPELERAAAAPLAAPERAPWIEPSKRGVEVA
ncbi:MAG: GntR family transcriptional regulator [Alphaproteobacteria bacterium]